MWPCCHCLLAEQVGSSTNFAAGFCSGGGWYTSAYSAFVQGAAAVVSVVVQVCPAASSASLYERV